MRAMLCGLFLSLAACGPDETKFIPEFADAYCDFVLECEDPAVLTFDGITSHDECLEVYGPEVEALGFGCKYKAKQARRCLQAMEVAACPAEGTTLQDGLPAVCNEVYIDCEVPSPGTSDPTPDDSGS